MSEHELELNYNLSWLIFKWWVAPLLAVLAGICLGMVMRYGAIDMANLLMPTFNVNAAVLSQAYDC